MVNRNGEMDNIIESMQLQLASLQSRAPTGDQDSFEEVASIGKIDTANLVQSIRLLLNSLETMALGDDHPSPEVTNRARIDDAGDLVEEGKEEEVAEEEEEDNEEERDPRVCKIRGEIFSLYYISIRGNVFDLSRNARAPNLCFNCDDDQRHWVIDCPHCPECRQPKWRQAVPIVPQEQHATPGLGFYYKKSVVHVVPDEDALGFTNP